MKAKLTILAVLTTLLVAGGHLAAQQPKTLAAFDTYVSEAEARIGRERNSTFLNLESLPSAQRGEVINRLRQGEVVIEKRGNTPEQVPDGLIHDWLGVVFIPHVDIEQVIGLVRDYNRTAQYYSPDVMQSRLESEHGDDLHVFMRLRKHKVITVVLDTEYDVHYGRIDKAHQYSVSRSTRVTEVENPGEANEHVLPPGRDHGYMWRLNTYWAFEQAKDGVFVQCEAISLTRDIPAGLTWVVGPFVNDIPRESLQFTLSATRAAVSGKASGARKQD